MSLSATLFGSDSLIFKATNILGLGIPGLLNDWANPEQKGQRIGDISNQTAKEGDPRTIVFGRVRPIGPNLIQCQTPVKKMVKEKAEGGGKGGSGKKETVKREHVFRTYAMGVCEGPITGYMRIWRNGKLVYDATRSSPESIAWGDKNNPVFLKNFRLYLGDWDQMPDSTLESIWGVGEVPAYRSTAYMVAINEDLTDMGGQVPQWLYEVERAEGIFLTSKLYPVEMTDGFNSTSGAITPIQTASSLDSFMTSDAGLISGIHRTGFQSYDNGLPDSFNATDAGLISGIHRTGFQSYNNYPVEEIGVTDAGVISGLHRNGLVTYTYWPVESVNVSDAGILSGVHNA